MANCPTEFRDSLKEEEEGCIRASEKQLKDNPKNILRRGTLHTKGKRVMYELLTHHSTMKKNLSPCARGHRQVDRFSRIRDKREINDCKDAMKSSRDAGKELPII